MRRSLYFMIVLAGPAAAQTVDFNRDVRPILSNNCFACHGPDEKVRKGELRLDTREGAIADLGGHAAVAPGKIEVLQATGRPTETEVPCRRIDEVFEQMRKASQ